MGAASDTDRDGDLGAELAQLRAELAEQREQQQAFLRAISHDLRSPVRHIVSYGQLVRELVQDSNADPSAVQYLDTITQSARHLGQMIDGLIALARIGAAELHVQPVPLADVLSEVVSQAKAACGERAVQWQWPEAQDLPRVQADLAQLRDLLRLLLDNAVKFTRRQPEARIAIDVQSQGPQVQLTLQDNGAGFRPEHADQLFGVFQRLHTVRDFEGLGLGLAMARRMVDRLGGELALQGQHGQGCTVTLRLPAA